MLHKHAVQKFLARKRRDFRNWKRIHDEHLEHLKQALPVRPPVWSKLKRHQKVCFVVGARERKFAFFNDTGCVAAGTLIETDNGPVAIERLCQLGRPIHVFALTENGPRLVPASCPFRLGPTDLYEVQFASGRSITVTARHRFLTERGWIFCGELRIGERLPKFEDIRFETSSAPYLSKSQLSVAHWSDTLPNYQECFDNRVYDEPLPLATDSAPTLLPLSDDFRARNRLELHMDDLDTLHKRSNHNASDHHATIHYVHLSNLGSNCMEYPCDVIPARSFDVITRSVVTALSAANPSLPDDVSLEHAFSYVDAQPRSHPNDSPLAFQPSAFDTVTSIAYKETNYYYDLHVPGYENYIAHGLCHHNTGKTFLSIALVQYFKSLGILKRALVLVPRRVNKGEWAQQIRKHAPGLKFLVLRGSSQEKWHALMNSDATLVIETYGGFARLGCVTVPHKRKKGKKRLKPSPVLVRRLTQQFEGLITDEGTVLGNHSSLPFRICRKIVKTAPVYFNLTGTPFGRDPTLLWSQMFLVDGGQTLGETLGLFRATFFKESENYWGGYDYTFDDSKKKLLWRVLANRSIRYKADQSDLPTTHRVPKYVSLTHDASVYADRAKQALIAAKGKYQEMKNAFIRMRQISSGWIGYKDDQLGERAQFVFDENPKLEMLMSILTSIEHKAVVLTEFHFSGDQIAAALEEEEIDHCRIYGKTKDPEKELRVFNADDNKRVLVLSNAMAIGLNLQIAKYAIFYESPVSVIMRTQAERRVERQGSHHDVVFIYDLITRGTFDQRILKFHAQGKDLFQAIIEGEQV